MSSTLCLEAQVITRGMSQDQINNFRKSKTEILKSRIFSLPPVDNNLLVSQDDLENKVGPYKFGKSFPVSIDIKKQGARNIVENGTVYSLEVESKDAYSLNFVFNMFHLSSGSEVIIYNSDKSMLIGPITSKNNNDKERFRTDLLKGDRATIELFEPNRVQSKPSILILDEIVHGYRNTFRSGYGDSESCNIDVVCSPEGDGWLDESNSVVLILLNNNELCTGALINNACQDYTPNVLSAFHCIDLNGNGTLEAGEIDNAEDWVFRFKYRSPSCGGAEPPSYTWITYQGGSTFRSAWSQSDFSLVEMNEMPDGKDVIQLAGWSRSTTSINNTAGIHHPNGDVMKISIDDHSPTFTTPTYFGYQVGTNHFWRVSWDDGITARGSSGSPLFNNDGRIIGQLAGGGSFCATPQSPDQYGRFDESWDGSGQAIDEELGAWLTNDPNVQTTNALVIPHVRRVIGPYVVTTNNSATFEIFNVFPTHNVTWTSTSNLTIISQDNTSVTVKYSGSNYGEGTVTANVQNNDPNLCPVIATFDGSLQAGPFTSSQIEISGFSGTTCYNTSYGYSAYVPGGHQSNFTYSWDYPQGWTVEAQYDNHIILNSENYVYSAEPIGVIINNGAGNSDWANIWVYNGYCSGSSYSYTYNTYPNPVSDELTVTQEPSGETSPTLANSEEEVMFNVKLFDIFQQPVAEKESCDNEVKIDTHNLKKGLYIMHIIDENGNVLKEKVIVE